MGIHEFPLQAASGPAIGASQGPMNPTAPDVILQGHDARVRELGFEGGDFSWSMWVRIFEWDLDDWMGVLFFLCVCVFVFRTFKGIS